MSLFEVSERFDCFGSTCEVFLTTEEAQEDARVAVVRAREQMLAWHRRFSRFLPDSELSLLNADPRHAVLVSAMMVRFAHAVAAAGERTGGLVDATQVEEIERAGYDSDLDIHTEQVPLSLCAALALAPPRRPARAGAARRWRTIEADIDSGVVRRPRGVRLDSGGLAKGLFADAIAEQLSGYAAFAVNCGGDLTIGGAQGLTRQVDVQSPFDGSVLHNFGLQHAGVATSGIGKRSWLHRDGRPAHHLLDPSSGRPAFTGVVQATAFAPTALDAEIAAKAALLSGPQAAHYWLRDGGVIVFDDGSHEVVEPAPTVTLSELSAYA